MFTSHGHHIPGTTLDDTDDNQRNVMRCGGTRFCSECSTEALKFRDVAPIRHFNDVVDIGPECFASGDLTVISYKGENYYKACGEVVTGPLDQTVDAARSHCVLRVGHRDPTHVDYYGAERTLMSTTTFDAVVRNDARRVLSLTGLEIQEIYNALNALEREGFTLTRENRG